MVQQILNIHSTRLNRLPRNQCFCHKRLHDIRCKVQFHRHLFVLSALLEKAPFDYELIGTQDHILSSMPRWGKTYFAPTAGHMDIAPASSAEGATAKSW